MIVTLVGSMALEFLISTFARLSLSPFPPSPPV